MFNHAKRAAAAVIAAYLLAGCGQGVLTATELSGAGTADLRGMAGDQKGAFGGHRGGPGGEKGGPGGMRGGMGGPMELFALADLTAEQKTQIQAIQEKYRPARPEGQPGDQPLNPGAHLSELLKADTLDVDALKAALAARPARTAGDRPDPTAMLAEIRAVLTDAQRAAIAAKLEAMPAPRAKADDASRADRPAPPTVEERTAKVAEKLSLTDAQKAALVTFETALEANRPQGAKPEQDHAAHQAAMIAFWKTGDTTALAALKPPAIEPPAFPVDAFIALAQTLTADQRVQLLVRGPMGGPGGPSGHGGPGGHDGPGAALAQ